LTAVALLIKVLGKSLKRGLLMTFRVAINGFGRIGRIALRIIEERKKLGQTEAEVVAVNDLSSADMLAHLLKYDSVHGRFKGDVLVDNQDLFVNGRKIEGLKIQDPAKLPWDRLGVDVVLEATGLFLNRDMALKHVAAGAKKVLLSAPADNPDATICYGVNHQVYRPEMTIISTASCTTNCIAPIARILHDELNILKASVTTIHSYTNDQRILDLPHSDKRRARAAALSMIPTGTGAAKAVSLVMPELEGKFQGIAVRVPTPNVSLIDMVCQVEKKTSVNAVNQILKQASMLPKWNNILGYSDEPLVSIDMVGTNCSSIVDSLCTQIVDNDLVKIMSWYDNEWGFTNREVDLIELLGTT
jgi:glyceraldehyde 3-phosphate dehydrogenase